MSNGSLTGRSLFVVDGDGKTKVRIDVPAAGQLGLQPSAEETIHLDGENAAIVLKLAGQTKIVLKAIAPNGIVGMPDASISLRGPTGHESISLQADGASLTLRHPVTGENTVFLDGLHADLVAGGGGQAGDFVLRNAQGQNTINFNGATADLVAGGGGQAGTLTLRNVNGQDTVHFNAEFADMLMGGNGQDGEIFLYPQAATAIGDLGQANIRLSAKTGDCHFQNADCAEEFDIAESEEIDQGTVMVLDQEGKLQQSKKAYDTKVAGVISGAGDCKPAIILDRKHSQHNRMPLALVGKVNCKVDAQYSSVEVGDLLTTSPTPGSAMKATDPLRAFGSVIGKALRPLKAGQGLIPILIALQ